MGRGIMKKMQITISLFIGAYVLASILAVSGCSVDMLDYIEEKIAEDEGDGVELAIYSFALDVTTDGPGSGSIDTVNSTPNGNYNAGTAVKAQATADSDSAFMGWYNAASGGTQVATANPYNFTLNTDTTLYAKWMMNDITSPNIGLLKVVPAGSFQRDSTVTNISTVTTAFRMSEKEITRAQFLDIMGTDPSYAIYSTGTDDPVQTTNWYHAIAFCNKLSIAEGLTNAGVQRNRVRNSC